MNRRHPQRSFIGWLALLALLLLNVVPTVSQWRSARWMAPDLGAWCGAHSAQGGSGHATHPSPHRAGLDACGYCGLIRHAPLLSGVGLPFALMVPLPQPVPQRLTILSRAAYSALAALPRGPPLGDLSLSHSS